LKKWKRIEFPLPLRERVRERGNQNFHPSLAPPIEGGENNLEVY
jgi:hypothetical protein